MNRHPNRLTLVVDTIAERGWTSAAATTGLLYLDSFEAVKQMMSGGAELDIERVILESGSADAADFLTLIANFGEEFGGDLLLIGADGGGFLSAIGRGGERVLYSPTERDVDFYLAIHGLTPAVKSNSFLPLIARLAEAQPQYVA